MKVRNWATALDQINSVVSVNCGGARHKIVVWVDGRIQLLSHTKETGLVDLSRELAGLPSEHECASALRSFRNYVGNHKLDGGPLAAIARVANDLHVVRNMRRSKSKTDPLATPLSVRILAMATPIATEAWQKFIKLHRASIKCAAADASSYQCRLGSYLGIVTTRTAHTRIGGPTKTTSTVYALLTAPPLGIYKAYKAGVLVLGGKARQPVFVVDVHDKGPDGSMNVTAVRKAKSGITLQLWRGDLKRDVLPLERDFESISDDTWWSIRWTKMLRCLGQNIARPQNNDALPGRS